MALLTAVMGFGGCAGVNAYQPPTTGEIAAAENGVQAARKSGAGRGEPSAKYVRVAEEQLANGRQEMQAGDNRNAVWSFARSAADADLAVALNRQIREEGDARRLERQLAETREEMVRRPPMTTPTPTPSVPQ
jgi:hypothetical protein